MWWRTSNCSSLLIYRLREHKRLSWPGWLTYSRRLTHISGHPSATARAQDGKRMLARDWRSTAEPCRPKGNNYNTMSCSWTKTTEWIFVTQVTWWNEQNKLSHGQNTEEWDYQYVFNSIIPLQADTVLLALYRTAAGFISMQLYKYLLHDGGKECIYIWQHGQCSQHQC